MGVYAMRDLRSHRPAKVRLCKLPLCGGSLTTARSGRRPVLERENSVECIGPLPIPAALHITPKVPLYIRNRSAAGHPIHHLFHPHPQAIRRPAS